MALMSEVLRVKLPGGAPASGAQPAGDLCGKPCKHARNRTTENCGGVPSAAVNCDAMGGRCVAVRRTCDFFARGEPPVEVPTAHRRPTRAAPAARTKSNNKATKPKRRVAGRKSR